MDAVSGFNQIRNTKRAREVLAIVARSGKYLPVGLTSSQSAGAGLEALGVRQQGTPGKRAKHDAASVSRVGFGLSGFGRVLRRAILLVGHGPGGVLVSSVHECMCKRSCSGAVRCSMSGQPEKP